MVDVWLADKLNLTWSREERLRLAEVFVAEQIVGVGDGGWG